jgi:hypothetical protein
VGEITREDAIAWLTDWLGKPTSVDVRVDPAGADVSVLSAVGELRHWSDDGREPWATSLGDAVRQTMFGVYAVDGAHFGIGDRQPASRFTLEAVGPGEREQLRLSFGEEVELVVTQEPTLETARPEGIK